MIKKLNIARIFNSQKGDTILEVMICVAVLGFMLAAAFSLANRNQTSNRQSQERGEALQLANSQLELLKAYADARKLPSVDYFCVQQDVPAVPGNDSGLSVKALTTPIPAAPNAPGANYDTCVQDRYSYAIWSPSVSSNIDAKISPGVNVYAVTVRWESAGSAVTHEEVKLFYTIYDTDYTLL